MMMYGVQPLRQQQQDYERLFYSNSKLIDIPSSPADELITSSLSSEGAFATPNQLTAQYSVYEDAMTREALSVQTIVEQDYHRRRMIMMRNECSYNNNNDVLLHLSPTSLTVSTASRLDLSTPSFQLRQHHRRHHHRSSSPSPHPFAYEDDLLQKVEAEYTYNQCLLQQNKQQLYQLQQQQRIQRLQLLSCHNGVAQSGSDHRDYRVDNEGAISTKMSYSNEKRDDPLNSSNHESIVSDSSEVDVTANSKSNKKRVRFVSVASRSEIDETPICWSNRKRQKIHSATTDVIIIPGRDVYNEMNITSALWWDEQTISASRQLHKQVGDDHNEINDPDYCSSITFLMESFACNDSDNSEKADNSTISSSSHEEISEKQNQKSEPSSSTAVFRRTLLKHIKKIVTKSDTRGLEQRSVPKLKQNRRTASYTILNLQQQIRVTNRSYHQRLAKVALQQQQLKKASGATSAVIPPEKMTLLLRQKSLQVSRSSRQLAFRLAQADRLIANKIYAETSDKPTCLSNNENHVASLPACSSTPTTTSVYKNVIESSPSVSTSNVIAVEV